MDYDKTMSIPISHKHYSLNLSPFKKRVRSSFVQTFDPFNSSIKPDLQEIKYHLYESLLERLIEDDVFSIETFETRDRTEYYLDLVVLDKEAMYNYIHPNDSI